MESALQDWSLPGISIGLSSLTVARRSRPCHPAEFDPRGVKFSGFGHDAAARTKRFTTKPESRQSSSVMPSRVMDSSFGISRWDGAPRCPRASPDGAGGQKRGQGWKKCRDEWAVHG